MLVRGKTIDGLVVMFIGLDWIIWCVWNGYRYGYGMDERVFEDCYGRYCGGFGEVEWMREGVDFGFSGVYAAEGIL